MAIKRIKKSCFSLRSSEQERLVSCLMIMSYAFSFWPCLNSLHMLICGVTLVNVYLPDFPQTGEFWGEAEILSKLHHPNVVAFYGVVKDGPGGTLATVTEYMVDGSLRHVLVRKDR